MPRGLAKDALQLVVRAYFLLGGEPVCPHLQNKLRNLSIGRFFRQGLLEQHPRMPALAHHLLLKAIFDKVGVRSRRELVGQVFAQQRVGNLLPERTTEGEDHEEGVRGRPHRATKGNQRCS